MPEQVSKSGRIAALAKGCAATASSGHPCDPPFPRQIRQARRRADPRWRLRPGTPQRDSSMANKMLIDAAHPEETRVVVLRGNRVEEFDFETAQRKQLRGNIYLAKVTRVEPSLQAAFVEYGGNRHGFLAFSEIHPDYYQIPVADRQALIDADARAAARLRQRRGRARRRAWTRPPTRPRSSQASRPRRHGPQRAHEWRTCERRGATRRRAKWPTTRRKTRPASARWASPRRRLRPTQRPQPYRDEPPGRSTGRHAETPEPMVAETANPPVPAEIGTDTVAPEGAAARGPRRGRRGNRR